MKIHRMTKEKNIEDDDETKERVLSDHGLSKRFVCLMYCWTDLKMVKFSTSDKASSPKSMVSIVNSFKKLIDSFNWHLACV